MSCARVASGVVLLALAGVAAHGAPTAPDGPGYLAAAASIAGVQALFIGGLLLQRKRRRQAELRLLESEALHRLTLGSISDAVFITSEDGRFTFVCPNVHVIFGYTRAETERLGTIRALLGDAVPDTVTSSTETEVPNLECEIRDKAGRRHHLLVTVKRISIKGGTRLYTCRDVTDRRRAEDANRELAHVHRLAGMGALTGMIAHEVNQPLGAILANAEAAEMLLEQPNPPLNEIRDILADIRRSDLRADEAIRHIRTLLRRHELQISEVQLDAIVGEVLQLVTGDASRRQIVIRTDHETGLPPAAGDPVHLQHVILNLVLNAMEAMAGTPPEARELSIRTRRAAAGMLEVIVADRGPGIPPEELPKIFDSFFTTKTNGMGLGLSIARSIISAHHGQIRAENNSQGGATLRFTIPVAEPVAAAAAAG
jgi:PAS domain S-box-containing protein